MDTRIPDDFINDAEIAKTLAENNAPATERIREILEKAKTLKSLNIAETAALTHVEDAALTAEMLAAANHVKNAIYGRRIVIFAPPRPSRSIVWTTPRRKRRL